MGSLESGLSLKRVSLVRSSSATSRIERNPFAQRPRSRFARFLLFKKIDYLIWVCTVAVFFIFVLIFQMFLPGSFVEKSGNFLKERKVISDDLLFLGEIGGLDFGDDVKFDPSKLLLKFQPSDVNLSIGSRRLIRFGYRKAKLALVFPDLLVDPQQLVMVTVATALREIGYEIEVYSLEDGPVYSVWKKIGVPVNIVETSETTIDWLNYDGVLVNSLAAREIIYGLLQEPFKSVPLIWTIHERTLASRFKNYLLNGKVEVIDNWKVYFHRAAVVVYPNLALPVFYAAFNAGNYYVIPGSLVGACEANSSVVVPENDLGIEMVVGSNDFVVAVASSQLLYGGLWLEHALILHSLSPIVSEFSVDDSLNSHLRIVFLTGDATGNYSTALEEIALNLKYPRGTVKHATLDEYSDSVLSMASVVIYGSFHEEQFFPDILIKAMCFEKPIIAPDLPMIKNYIDDRVNGYIFPKESVGVLTQIMLQILSKGKLSPSARNVASIGKRTAKNLMVSESVEGYALLLQNVLRLPSEVALPRPVSEIPHNVKAEWQWHLFKDVIDLTYPNRTLRSYSFLDKVEMQLNSTGKDSTDTMASTEEIFLYSIWLEEKKFEMAKIKKRREDNELKDRTDQARGTWEEVYRSVKRADRLKNDLHERDDGELERTGQPLCIYEPYYGQGAWPFLHHTALYRGIGLSTKGRRPGADDLDAPSRLPLLNAPYYRDVLGEFGAFFAIANRIDRVHKNAWIGFTSWRAGTLKASLSKTAEVALLDAIETRKHGDALYFWVRMDNDPRNPLQKDFWSFCDSINAGNCKFAFAEALKKMYGIMHDGDYVPPMPPDGDAWSVLHSWVLPTKSFLEFVMFSRMFVDALDAEMYDEHYRGGRCYLSLSKDKHCYSRVLEVIVNVWAYHSARRMIYIDPRTGSTQEQHKFRSRRGHMWVKWFNHQTLKGMDEELAEEFDSDHPKRRWLWPLTGEVYWQGMLERERDELKRERERRKQKSKDKIQRIKSRTHQKTLGKYFKPPPEGTGANSTGEVFR